MIWKRDDWNGILRRINDLIDSGCFSDSPLEEVDENHVWTKEDITAVRDRLTEICANAPEFSVPLSKWTREIIDEIEAAIEGCECCDPTIDDGLVFQPLALQERHYASQHFVIYYISPANFPLGEDHIIGRLAHLTPNRILGQQSSACLDNGGNMVAATWEPYYGDWATNQYLTAAFQLASQGLIPIAGWPYKQSSPGVWTPPTWNPALFGRATILSHALWRRCSRTISRPDYHASVGGQSDAYSPLSQKWWPSQEALETAIETYNHKHSPKLAIQNINPWTAYYPSTARNAALAAGCFFVSLGYV